MLKHQNSREITNEAQKNKYENNICLGMPTRHERAGTLCTMNEALSRRKS